MGPGRDWLTSEKNIRYMLNTSISCTTEITTRPIASTSINSIERTMQNIGMSIMQSDAHSRNSYHEKRCDILLKKKQDRAPCPLCNLTFRRVYIPIHVSRRHPVQ